MKIRQALANAIQMHRDGQTALAEQGYRSVLQARPREVAALHCYGMLCLEGGRWEEAAGLLERAVAADRRNAAAHADLARALAHLDRGDAVVAAWRAAVRLAPAEAAFRLGLGNALAAAGQPDAALVACREAVRLAPDMPEAQCGLGNALIDCGWPDEALLPLDRATRLRPAFAEAHNSLGVALFELRELPRAVAAFRAAIRLRPDYAEAHGNLGAVLYEQGEQPAALAALRHAVSLDPAACDVHFHLAQALLRQGDWAEGWREYEWRRAKPGFPRLPGLAPDWRGEDLGGRTLLLYAEQGLGDALQFLRFAVAARGGRVVVAVPAALTRLAATAPGVAAVADLHAPLPPHDLSLPLMSLPGLLGVTPDSIPAAVPYLQAEPGPWPGRLAHLPGLRVGLVWSGAPRPHDRQASLVDRRRSLRLEQLADLAEVEGVSFVSLQKGPAAGQSGVPLFDPMDAMGDFADTAALVQALDLVVTVDTSMAHLAGALGKPVWVLSRFDGCWRWLQDRDDTPWYPAARLFRQRSPGDWAGVVAQVAGELRRAAMNDRARILPGSATFC